MYQLFKTHSLRLFLIIAYLTMTIGQWVDPHSMDTNAKNKLPNRSQKVPEIDIKQPLSRGNLCDSDLHIRRIVRLILRNSYLDSDMGYYEGYINLKLSSNEHQFLIKFSQSSDPEAKTISDVSAILENALQKPSIEKYHQIALSMQEKIYEIVFNPTSAILFTTAVLLYIMYRLIMAEFTWKSILQYFLFFSYLLDFIITYLHIIRDAEIDSMVNIKTMGPRPPECNPEKMTWWSYAKTRLESTFFENPCKVYYQSTFENYKYIIAPSKVFVRQFKTFMEPVGDVGEAFGKFGRGMFTSLPWGLNVVLFPIMLVAALGIIFLLFLFLTKPQFRISLFRFFTIELGQTPRVESLPAVRTVGRNNQRAIAHEESRAVRRRRNANNNREVGIATNHRALVEDVSNSSQASGQTEAAPVTTLHEAEDSSKRCGNKRDTRDKNGGGNNQSSVSLEEES